jgi:small subunit ribosomal protein S1
MNQDNIDNVSLNTNEAGVLKYEESFADMLEKSSFLSERLRPGQRVKTRIISISGDQVYIDLHGKSEGVIDLSEFTNEDGTVFAKEGDVIDAYFLNVENGTRKLTTRIHGYSAVKLNTIRSAFEAGIPVNGEVKREIKSGFEVSVSGIKCFCPFSQIDLRGGHKESIYLGQSFPFKVLEFTSEGRNIVVSRRALLEEEKLEQINKLKESLSNGMEITGTIRAVKNFGAFIDIGGIDGLIPASEISWNRSDSPANVLSIGQEVKARIISLDWDNNQLTLSIKATQPDPWTGVEEKYPVGSRINGNIVRLTPFGAFVTLESGIDGLIHISNLGAGRRINHPKEIVTTGQAVEAYVLSVDTANRKISLSMQPKVEPKEIILPSVGEQVEGVVDKIMPFGIFLKMETGLSGLIPNSETGTPSGTDLKKTFKPGTKMQAVVIEADSGKNRIKLSCKALTEKADREDFEQYVDTAKTDSPSPKNLGSLGEILRAKMEEKNLSV